MQPIASPLKIVDFALSELHFELVFGKKEDIDIYPFFPKYAVDIDFDLSLEDGPRVFIRADINNTGKQLPGYSIEAEAVCIFEFDEKAKLTPEEKAGIMDFSTIYIALNSLRGLISNFTATAPFGRYMLPSIDLNTLIRQKRQAAAAPSAKRKNNKPMIKKTRKKNTKAK